MSTHTSGMANLPRFELPAKPQPAEFPTYNQPFVGSVAYAASLSPNVDDNDIINIGTLTGNISILTPTGTPQDGQYLILRFKQDATGGRTYTFAASYVFGATYPLLSWTTTANASVEAEFRYHAGTAKWRHYNFANF